MEEIKYEACQAIFSVIRNEFKKTNSAGILLIIRNLMLVENVKTLPVYYTSRLSLLVSIMTQT